MSDIFKKKVIEKHTQSLSSILFELEQGRLRVEDFDREIIERLMLQLATQQKNIGETTNAGN